jgi:hypothetical protein
VRWRDRLPSWWKWAAGAAAVVALLFGSSCWASHCRSWGGGGEDPPPPREDQGELVPAIADAPTEVVCPEIAVPVLDRAELEIYAARFGLVLADRPSRYGADARPRRADEAPVPLAPRADEGSTPPPAVTGEPPEPGYPLLLTGETFQSPDTGQGVEVSAWALCRGCRADLRAVWGPPPPKERESWLGNVGRAEWELGPAFIASVRKDEETVTEPGALVAWRFRSWRAGRATLNARALGLLGQETQTGAGALTVSWP